jgi:hypothetical protein
VSWHSATICWGAFFLHISRFQESCILKRVYGINFECIRIGRKTCIRLSATILLRNSVHGLKLGVGVTDIHRVFG